MVDEDFHSLYRGNNHTGARLLAKGMLGVKGSSGS